MNKEYCMTNSVVTRKLIEHTAENIIWGQSRKYNMGPTQKIQAQANAENTSGPHDESPHGGGPHIFNICLRLYVLLRPYITLCFWATGPPKPCFSGTCIQYHPLQIFSPGGQPISVGPGGAWGAVEPGGRVGPRCAAGAVGPWAPLAHGPMGPMPLRSPYIVCIHISCICLYMLCIVIYIYIYVYAGGEPTGSPKDFQRWSPIGHPSTRTHLLLNLLPPQPPKRERPSVALCAILNAGSVWSKYMSSNKRDYIANTLWDFFWL